MSKPLRILYTIPNFVTAGSGQAMVNIIDRLDRRRFEPTVAVRKRGGHLIDHLEATGVSVIEADFTVALAPLATLPFRIWRARRPFRSRFDVWHSFNWAGEFTEPLIAYTSGARSWVYTKKNMGWGTRSWKLRSLLARRIAVQNDAMPDLFFASRWLRHKVRYIPTGIDIESWQSAEPDTSMRARLGIAEDSIVITCVGDIQPRKNQRALVEALAAVPDAHLVLAGRSLDKSYTEGLIAQATELAMGERLHLLGPVDGVAALLKSSDIFALVSYAEGSPIAMLEAMAMAMPGVYSAIAGMRERITDGSDGFLVDPDDRGLLTERLADLAASAELRRVVGLEARRSTEMRARVEVEAARYETLYLELATNR